MRKHKKLKQKGAADPSYFQKNQTTDNQKQTEEKSKQIDTICDNVFKGYALQKITIKALPKTLQELSKTWN